MIRENAILNDGLSSLRRQSFSGCGRVAAWPSFGVFMILRLLFVSTTLVMLGTFESAALADSESKVKGAETVHLKNDRDYLLAQPGGSVMGELYHTADIKVIDTKGDWSKVVINGWVRTKSLSSAPLASKGAANADVIKLVSFSIDDKQYSATEKRRQLTIKVKNNTTSFISSWTGFLTSKDFAGKLVLQESVSDLKADLEPGKEKELHYIYKAGDKQYNSLGRIQSEQFAITVTGVVVR